MINILTYALRILRRRGELPHKDPMIDYPSLLSPNESPTLICEMVQVARGASKRHKQALPIVQTEEKLELKII